MLQRSSVAAFALIVAFILGGFLMSRPPTVTAQPPAGRGKCVGMAVQGAVVYRAFEDGTVESLSHADGPPAKAWRKVGE
jgi:hypothetical protein